MEGDVVAQFTEITGSTPELAAQYLEVADFNIEQAMQLYFENGGAEIAEQPSHPPPASSRPQHASPTRGYEDETGIVHLDSDDEDVTVDETRSSPPSRHPPVSNYEDDAAMAQRLQEELYAGGDSSDGVRAPMARTTETLVGPGPEGYDDGDMQTAILNQLRARQTRGG
jgi:hypothetical protein